MDPWNYEADLVKFTDDFDAFTLVQNKVVDGFVSHIDRDSRFFVVAPKGLGKTLLLKYKSAKYRRERPDFVFIPRTELCEKLTSITSTIALGKHDLTTFTTRNHWHDIWTICLSSIILKETGTAIPAELESVFRGCTSIDDVLKALLGDRKHLLRYASLIPSHLSPAIQRLRTPVAVFLDNVDEAMDRHVGIDLLRSRRRQGGPLGAVSESVWVNAQLGLIDAAKGLHDRNSHIKLFASIRLEAFTADASSTHTQTGIYCAFLKYSDPDLQKIFDSNIEAMKRSDLVSPDARTQMERLLGFAQIPHPSVRDGTGNFRREDVFRFFLRHTLRRPRELLQLGHRISQLAPSDRTPISIRTLVNDLSTELLTQYQNETVPYWDYAESNAILASVRKNIIPRAQIQRLSSAISARVRRTLDGGGSAAGLYHAHPFCSFYRRGLLGFLHSRASSNQLNQTFLPAAEYIFDDRATLPKSDYYLLHPCLVSELRRIHGPAFAFDQHNIVGYDYAFIDPVGGRKGHQHVHFGAGRLGLGLVLPLLANMRNICIIQRPTSANWIPLQELLQKRNESSEVELRVPNAAIRLRVIRDDIDETVAHSAIQHWRNGGHLLVLSGNLPFLRAMIAEATSISTALKTGLPFAAELLTSVKPRTLRNIYCFENEFKDVEEFRQRVQASNKRYKVMSVVADRICRSFHVSDGEVPLVIVDCEPYRHVYIENQNAGVRRLFGERPDVTLARDSEELMYFYEKKFYLMNSVQAAMAFHAYAKLAQRGIHFEKWGEQVLVIDTDAPYVAVWRQIQICRIIYRHSGVLRRWFPTKDEKTLFVELAAQAYAYAQRIEKSGDQIQRILATDSRSLDEKFESRCRETTEFVRDHWAEVESWGIPSMPSKVDVLSQLTEFSDRVITVVMKALRAGAK